MAATIIAPVIARVRSAGNGLKKEHRQAQALLSRDGMAGTRACVCARTAWSRSPQCENCTCNGGAPIWSTNL